MGRGAIRPTRTTRNHKSERALRFVSLEEGDWTLKQACFQGYPESAVCVQESVGSRNSAIHIAYRSSLHPSSLFEARHHSMKVVFRNNARARRYKAMHGQHIYRYECVCLSILHQYFFPYFPFNYQGSSVPQLHQANLLCRCSNPVFPSQEALCRSSSV